MQKSGHSRRALIGAGLATTLPFLNPGRGPHGQFHLVRPANAWIQVAALALSAISTFSKGGDGGLGAYLSNIKALSEENIRLSQNILARVSDLQASMQQLPERMRRVFIEVTGYQLAQQAQTGLNLVLAVEASVKANGRLTAADRVRCEDALAICANLTGARAAPYGIGGTAASCIAMVSAIDARAHYFLGRSDAFRRWVGIAYLPWLDAMLSAQDYSVMGTLREEGGLLNSMTQASLAGLPAAQRAVIENHWQQLVLAEPGTSSQEFVLACGTYAAQTGVNRRCVEHECTEPPGRRISSVEGKTGKALRAFQGSPLRAVSFEGQQSKPVSQAALAGMSTAGASPLGCFCSRVEEDRVYAPASASGLLGRLRAVTGEDGATQLVLDRRWAAQPVENCVAVVNGTAAGGADQTAAVQGHFKPISDAMDKFETTDLAAYNAQRVLVYTTYRLMDATRATRNALARVAS